MKNTSKVKVIRKNNFKIILPSFIHYNNFITNHISHWYKSIPIIEEEFKEYKDLSKISREENLFSVIENPVDFLKNSYRDSLLSDINPTKRLILKNNLSFESYCKLQNKTDLVPPHNPQVKMLGIKLSEDSKANCQQIDEIVNSSNIYLFRSRHSLFMFSEILKKLELIPKAPLNIELSKNFRYQVISDSLILEKELISSNGLDYYLYQQIVKKKKNINVYYIFLKMLNPISLFYPFLKKIKGYLKSIKINSQNSKTEKVLIKEYYSFGKTRKLYLNSNDIKGKRYYIKKNWEDISHELWRISCNYCDTIVDVGSNYGEFLACLDVDEKNIYSIEVNSNVLSLQKKSLKYLSKVNQVEYINKIASNEYGYKYISINNLDSGATSLYNDVSKKVKLETITIDSLISRSKSVALKIDTEGNDVSVLKSSLSILSKVNFLITLECSNTDIKELLKIKEKMNPKIQWFLFYDNNFRLWEDKFKYPNNQSFFDVYISNINESNEFITNKILTQYLIEK